MPPNCDYWRSNSHSGAEASGRTKRREWCRLVVAGLAKGAHQDRDDFYKCVQRANGSGDLRAWLPTQDDLRLLKQETAARIRTQWELDTQRLIRDALGAIHSGGSRRIKIGHPVAGKGNIAQLDLSVTTVRESDYEADEINLDITPGTGFSGSNLLWQLTTRVLISISPPEQSWDRYKDTYSNIDEVNAWAERIAQLDELVASNLLAESVPGSNESLQPPKALGREHDKRQRSQGSVRHVLRTDPRPRSIARLPHLQRAVRRVAHLGRSQLTRRLVPRRRRN